MKKILVHISSVFVAKNFLRSGALDALLRDHDVSIALLVQKKQQEHLAEEFGNERVSCVELPSDMLSPRLVLAYQFVSENSLSTETVRIKQYHGLYHDAGPLALRIVVFLIRRVLWYVGKIPAWKRVVGAVFLAVAGRRAESLFEEEYDLLYLPTLLYAMDWLLLGEARRQSVPVVASIPSWDNLTSKLLLTGVPDLLTTPNHIVKEEAMRLGSIPEKRIRVVGYPQYDRYVTKRDILPYDTFARSLKLDPTKPFLLYAMAGPKNMPHEHAVLSGIREAMDQGRLPDLQVVIRPYPKYSYLAYQEESLASDPRFVFDHHAAHLMGGRAWDMRDEEIKHLANSLAHAAAVVSVGSTILIEALASGTPSINIAFAGIRGEERPRSRGWYASPARFLCYDHLATLLKQGGILNASTPDELVSAIKKAREDRAGVLRRSEATLAAQIARTDGTAAQTLAATILDCLNESNHG